MKFYKIIAILAIISICISCSGNKKDNTITLGVMSSMDYLPLAIAQREGYFEKHGVDVNIQKFISATERDVALQSGVVDGVVTDYTSAALVKSGGFELKLTSKCQAPFYIVAGKETGINNLSELKEKKVAVSQNTVIDFCVDVALNSVGLAETDVEKVEINKIPLRLEMLRNNKIDATGLPDPLGLIAESEGNKLLVSMDSLGYTVTGIVFTQKAIDDKGEAIKLMYKAYNDGVDYLKSHSINDIKDILVKDMRFPEGMVDKAQIPDYTAAQAPAASDKDIQEVVKWLIGRKLIPESFDATGMIDNRFVAE
jgi:NitT/TauT family transport system substrate-binding protein